MRRPNPALVFAVVGLALASVQAQQKAKTAQFVAGEIVLQFSPSAGQARINGVLGSSATRVIRYYSAVDVYHLRVPPGQSTEWAMTHFRSLPEVLAVQPNYIRRVIASPNDPFWTGGQLWGLEKIRANAVWDQLSIGDPSVVIANIDTGVEYTHADLASNMWRNPGEIPGNRADDDNNGYVDDVFGIDVINANETPGGPEDPMDDQGHGTHVAGTIAGVGNNGAGVAGVTWNSKILACKFIGSNGEGTDADAIGCFDYIVALKRRGVNIRVSNNSWGSCDGPAPVLQSAIDVTGEAGILNVFAAGNGESDNDATPYYPSNLSSPSIVAVAASDASDNRASYSNVGATMVDLAAPGSGIVSTFVGGGYATSSGTSMAASHVAGAAALLIALDPTLTVDSLKTLLMESVDVLPQWQGAVVSGGRLNVFRAASELAGSTIPGATLVGTDTTTQGNWFLSYGLDGYAIHADGQSIPTYAEFSVTGASGLTWATSTTDVRALRRASPPGRLASAWTGGTIGFAINFTDGQAHDVAFYALDWDTSEREQRFEITDAVTGQLLATHTLGGFHGGHYIIWRLSGSVRIRVVTVAGAGAVLSGIFFGGPAASNQQPTASFTSPLDGASIGVATSIPVGVAAADDVGVAHVQFFANDEPIGTDTTSPYYVNWTNAAPGSYTLTATVTDTLGLTATAVPVQITATAGGSGPIAQFITTDTTTQGNWIGVYGTDGYRIVNETPSIPAYAQVIPSGTSAITWAASTIDVRALQRPSGTGRIASTWYSTTFFDITVNLTDGQAHDVAFYSLDWDTFDRAQRFDVYDAATNTLLATHTLDGFRNGVYTVWRFSGNVRVRVTRTGGAHALVSGVFFSTVPVSPGPN